MLLKIRTCAFAHSDPIEGEEETVRKSEINHQISEAQYGLSKFSLFYPFTPSQLPW